MQPREFVFEREHVYVGSSVNCRADSAAMFAPLPDMPKDHLGGWLPVAQRRRAGAHDRMHIVGVQLDDIAFRLWQRKKLPRLMNLVVYVQTQASTNYN